MCLAWHELRASGRSPGLMYSPMRFRWLGRTHDDQTLLLSEICVARVDAQGNPDARGILDDLEPRFRLMDP